MALIKTVAACGHSIRLISHDNGATWHSLQMVTGLPAGVHVMEDPGKVQIMHFERKISGRKGQKKMVTMPEEVSVRKLHAKREKGRALLDLGLFKESELKHLHEVECGDGLPSPTCWCQNPHSVYGGDPKRIPKPPRKRLISRDAGKTWEEETIKGIENTKTK